MIVTVQRKRITDDGFFGTLSLDWSAFGCFTVENKALAIAAGLYDLYFEYSPHFNRIMPHIRVPDRTHVMFHWANYPNQLEGCIAVGDKEEPDAVDDSIITFNRFYKLIDGHSDIQVRIRDIEPPVADLL